MAVRSAPTVGEAEPLIASANPLGLAIKGILSGTGGEKAWSVVVILVSLGGIGLAPLYFSNCAKGEGNFGSAVFSLIYIVALISCIGLLACLRKRNVEQAIPRDKFINYLTSGVYVSSVLCLIVNLVEVFFCAANG